MEDEGDDEGEPGPYDESAEEARTPKKPPDPAVSQRGGRSRSTISRTSPFAVGVSAA